MMVRSSSDILLQLGQLEEQIRGLEEILKGELNEEEIVHLLLSAIKKRAASKNP